MKNPRYVIAVPDLMVSAAAYRDVLDEIDDLHAAVAGKGPRSAPPPRGSGEGDMNADIRSFNASLNAEDSAICDTLAEEIDRGLDNAESKIWHRHPVWFLDGNPIVGYSRLKDGVRLLFWSGQSFEGPGLVPQGSFKAAEVRYTSVEQIDRDALKRWLSESRTIQWDYKNIVKRKGRLERV